MTCSEICEPTPEELQELLEIDALRDRDTAGERFDDLIEMYRSEM